MKRTATAQWQGGLKDVKGRISSASGVLSGTPYSFHTRFEQGQGTNPEELVAAAHASCFSMALSAQLGDAGLTPESIETQCDVTMDKTADGWVITESHLTVTARVPGGTEEKFQAAAGRAKTGCPISRLLNTKITMEAKLQTTASVS